jgi:hypothetical protein
MGQGRSSSESQVNPRRWAATWTCFIVKVMPGSFENNTEVATDHISPVLPQQLWLYWAHLLPTLSMWVFCRAEGRDKEEEAALPLMLSCGLTAPVLAVVTLPMGLSAPPGLWAHFTRLKNEHSTPAQVCVILWDLKDSEIVGRGASRLPRNNKQGCCLPECLTQLSFIWSVQQSVCKPFRDPGKDKVYSLGVLILEKETNSPRDSNSWAC